MRHNCLLVVYTILLLINNNNVFVVYDNNSDNITSIQRQKLKQIDKFLSYSFNIDVDNNYFNVVLLIQSYWRREIGSMSISNRKIDVSEHH